jgi:hypothetical protein
MIPYDDLVAALSAWRARQGLPVSSLGGAQAGSGPTAAPSPGSGPTAKPSSGRTKAPSMPPPVEMHDEEVGDAEMLEEHYETEGNDFAMNFNPGGGEAEATSIGGAPERPTDENMGGRGRNDRDDW